MTNHLNLKNTLFEFDEQGNLSIFSNGKLVSLLVTEVRQMRDWLNQEQKAKRLRTSKTRFVLDMRGSLIISSDGQSLHIPTVEVKQMQSWMNRAGTHS